MALETQEEIPYDIIPKYDEPGDEDQDLEDHDYVEDD